MSDRFIGSKVKPRLPAVRPGMTRVVNTRTVLLVDLDETVVVKKIIREG